MPSIASLLVIPAMSHRKGKASMCCRHRRRSDSAMISGKTKESAEAYPGATVTDAAVAVAAYFNDAQRKTTKDAGNIADLDIFRVINFIAYGVNMRSAGSRSLSTFGRRNFQCVLVRR